MKRLSAELCIMIITLCAFSTVTACATQASDGFWAGVSDEARHSLEKYLRSYLETPPWREDKTTRISVAFVHLTHNKEPQAIVYVTGWLWCGSGGCRTLILTKAGPSWRVVTDITITRPPIRVLSSEAKGWHDISVWVQGGGTHAHQARLRFDGKTYPTNPTVPPAKPLVGEATGVAVLFSADGGVPLYQ